MSQVPSFPLDVSVAAYHIKATNISYETYLENLVKHDKDFEDTQDNLLDHMSDYKDTRYKIITSSLKQVIQENVNFEKLLLFVSLLDSQDIPQILLEKCADSSTVDQFIFYMKKYSLITPQAHSSKTASPSFFSIHRSTQEISLSYLKSLLNLDQSKSSLEELGLVLERYVDDLLRKEDFLKIKALVNHCEVFYYQPLLPEKTKASIGVQLGRLYYSLDNYSKAKGILEESLRLLNKTDKEHRLVPYALASLGYIDRCMGHHQQAVTLLKQSLSIYEKSFPKDYEGIAQTLMYLGCVYKEINDYEKAKEFLIQSIKIYEEKLPHESLGAARTLIYLGDIDRRLGNYQEAKDAFEKALKVYQQHPQDHAGLGRMLIHLGSLYLDMGYYDKARDFIEQALTVYEDCLPKGHTKLAWVSSYLADVYFHLGKYDAAKDILEQSLTIYDNHYGKNHPISTGFLIKLAKVYRVLKENDKAEALLNQSLVILETEEEKDKVLTARALMELGQVHLSKNQFDESEQATQKALKILQEKGHPESYKALEYLADIYEKRLDLENDSSFKERTVDCLKESLKVLRKFFPHDSDIIKRIKSRLKNNKLN